MQQRTYAKRHFLPLPIWWLNADLDLLCKRNCVYFWQEYKQELSICAKQPTHLVLLLIESDFR